MCHECVGASSTLDHALRYLSLVLSSRNDLLDQALEMSKCGFVYSRIQAQTRRSSLLSLVPVWIDAQGVHSPAGYCS